jgi:maltooligosyltrehalose synthase
MLMKFKVTMKDPDVLDEAIIEAVEETVEDMPDDEQKAIMDVRLLKVKSITRKWFKYGEYLTVEIDTEAETCIVVPEKD